MTPWPLGEGHAAVGVFLRVLRVARVLHTVFVRQHGRPVHRGEAAAQADAIELAGQAAHQRSLAHCLGRHAVLGQAVAAEVADGIDHLHRQPGASQKKSAVIARATGAENQHIGRVMEGSQGGGNSRLHG